MVLGGKSTQEPPAASIRCRSRLLKSRPCACYPERAGRSGCRYRRVWSRTAVLSERMMVSRRIRCLAAWGIFAFLQLMVQPVLASLEEAQKAYERKDYAGAFAEFKRLADRGDPMASYWVADMYKAGLGTAKDASQAVVWFSRAAERGKNVFVGIGDYRMSVSVEALLTLGKMYREGDGVPKDVATSITWYRRAADEGHPLLATCTLGEIYRAGEGVSKDPAEAIVWFRRCAESGALTGIMALGEMYADGDGVPKDVTEAAVWFRKAADKGDISAEQRLGTLYLLGQGVPKDVSEAVSWLRKAADGGHHGAEFQIGAIYDAGEGVPKDYSIAVEWYKKAAEWGIAEAQNNLGTKMWLGEGIPKDEERAYFWWLLASAQGEEHATKSRDVVEPYLTAAQRIEAQTEARKWISGREKDEARLAAALDSLRNRSDAPAKPGPGTFSPQSAGALGAQPDSTGSGFRVAPGKYVTNFHVIDGCRRLAISDAGEAQVQSADAINDFALLVAASKSSTTATVRVGTIRVGEAVLVAGFPLRGLLSGFNVTAGTVSSLSGLRGDSRFVQITAPVQPGNSGAPLIDASGNVMGVVESKLDAVKVAQLTGDIPQNVNFAITANVLQGFLQANSVDFKSARLGRTRPTTELASRAREYAVLVSCWR